MHISKDEFIESLAPVFGGVLSLWIIWHCAYKKHGTKLLSFWLIATPFNQLVSILKVMAELDNGCTIAFMSINIVVFVWWYIMSLKLREINKSIQEQKSLVTQI